MSSRVEDHQDQAEKVAEAARWLAATPPAERGEGRLVPILCDRFDIGAIDACRAISAWRSGKAT